MASNITVNLTLLNEVTGSLATRFQTSLITALSQEFSKTIQVICIVIMILSQSGFGMLYAGLSRARNAMSSFVAVLVNIMVVIFCIWSVGYTFAWMSGNQFIGYKRKWFGSEIDTSDYLPWCLHVCYTLMVVNIASGGMIERAKPLGYFVLAFGVSFFIHPVVIHWSWDEEGWLQTVYLEDNKSVVFKDTGGSCVIHVCAGAIGLVGAILCRPRLEKVKQPCCCMKKVQVLHSHSALMTGFGGVVIYCGLVALQLSRTVSINANANSELLGMVIMNILLSSFGSAFIMLPLARLFNGSVKSYEESGFRWPIIHATINSFLVGLVSVAAGCDSYYSYFAFVVGLVGGVVYMLYSYLMYRCKVDDPADTFSVHFGPGFWGLLAAAIFSRTYGAAYYNNTNQQDKDTPYLIFTWNLIGGIVITAWCLLLSFIPLCILFVAGTLRLNKELQEEGVDSYIYSEFAYPPEAWRKVPEEDIKPQDDVLSEKPGVAPQSTYSHGYYDKYHNLPPFGENHRHHHPYCQQHHHHSCMHSIPRAKTKKSYKSYGSSYKI